MSRAGNSARVSSSQEGAVWMVLQGENQYGPYTVDEIGQYLASGSFSSDDLVWKEGLAEWTPIRTAFPFVARSGATPPPPPAKSKKKIKNSNRIAIGVMGILLGGFGIHKFMLGFTGPGIITLILGFFLVGWVIGFIEGIIYLTKTDEEFYEEYVVNKKQWF